MIIAVIGKKRSGKDTLADYLVKNFKFKKYGFGDPVKEISKLMFGFSQEQIDTDLKEIKDSKWNITPRESFQLIGTEFGRNLLNQKLSHINCDEGEFWIRKFEIWYQEQVSINPHVKIVINDVRFLNEFNCLKKLNAIFIKINRNTGLIDNHISENNLNNIDSRNINITIENNTTIEDFYNKIQIMEELLNI